MLAAWSRRTGASGANVPSVMPGDHPQAERGPQRPSRRGGRPCRRTSARRSATARPRGTRWSGSRSRRTRRGSWSRSGRSGCRCGRGRSRPSPVPRRRRGGRTPVAGTSVKRPTAGTAGSRPARSSDAGDHRGDLAAGQAERRAVGAVAAALGDPELDQAADRAACTPAPTSANAAATRGGRPAPACRGGRAAAARAPPRPSGSRACPAADARRHGRPRRRGRLGRLRWCSAPTRPRRSRAAPPARCPTSGRARCPERSRARGCPARRRRRGRGCGRCSSRTAPAWSIAATPITLSSRHATGNSGAASRVFGPVLPAAVTTGRPDSASAVCSATTDAGRSSSR